MISQQEFQQKLAEILAEAEASDFHMDQNKVENFFTQGELTDEQMKLVFNYLLSKKVVVDGYLKEAEQPILSAEDLKYLKEYEEMLKQVGPELAGEKERLLERAQKGEPEAKKRLSELILPQVLQAAKEMYVPEVPISDLVQEGNLNLLLEIEGLANTTIQEFCVVESRILRAIRQGMQALTEQQKDMKRQDHRMVTKVQELKDSVAVLKEEMGRKVYLDEVADFMSISEGEAEAILKLAGEEVPEEDE